MTDFFSHAILPTALYIHIPWCVHKCPYCDFNSHEIDGCPDAMGYVRALLDDLSFELASLPEREIITLFIGGGTPSLFPPEAIATLLHGVRQRVSLAKNAEITMEANPGTWESDWYQGYREAGVTRLSIGVQSFHDDSLNALGRIHDGRQATHAIEQAKLAGFSQINLDLMFGLPGQTLEMARQDILQAVAFGVPHLSYYQLTLEPNTLFYARPPRLPDEEAIADIHDAGLVELARAGYRQYEVSAFAQPGSECRHNLNYWQFGDYLGIGAGAHGKLTLAGGVERRRRLRHPRDYLVAGGTAGAVSGVSVLDEQDLIMEFFMNGLRLRQGFSPRLFSDRTGLPWSAVAPKVERQIALGLLQSEGDKIMTTSHGWRYLNEILQEYICE